MSNYEKLCEEISKQQKGHEKKPEWYVGEQIKDICRGSEEYSGMVLNDISKDGMKIYDAEKKIRERAKVNGGCCAWQEAGEIIRELYGLGADGTAPDSRSGSVIELASFL